MSGAPSLSSFDPSAFLRVAEDLLPTERDADQAVYRTIAGRSYYAVYGYVRKRICKAKDMSPGVLFKDYGRHHKLVHKMGSRETAPAVQRARPYLNALLHRRAQADYKYRALDALSWGEAEAAVQEAQAALEILRGVSDSDLATVPLDPA